MNTILETLNIKGFDVNILADRDAENPLAWGSATLVTAHRRYTFGGDRLPFDANSIEEAFDWHLDSKGLTRRDVIWLPVYLYDHSGLALSDTPFGDRWDSGAARLHLRKPQRHPCGIPRAAHQRQTGAVRA